MAIKKYINTTEVVELTGRPYNEILNLIKSGVLPGHRTRRGHFRLNVDAVEEYFGIQINTPEEMKEKLISRLTATKYLNCSNAKFESLVSRGLIQAHRDERKRWRVSKESVLKLVEQTNPSKSIAHKPKKKVHRSVKQPLSTIDTRLIINESHYQEVLERIGTAKLSVRIMTANFYRFNLKPTGNQGLEYKDGTPFIKYLMAKAVQGVSVQIICSRPSASFMEEWKDYFHQMMDPALFNYKFCTRNHAKIVIIDDKFAYVGSANVTPAGMGQGIFTPGNFEAGFLTEDPNLVSSVIELFSKVWNEEYCTNCHRAGKCEE